MTDTTFQTKEETLRSILSSITFGEMALKTHTRGYIEEPTPERRYTVQRAYRNLQSNLKKLENELGLNEPYLEGKH